MSRKDPAYTGVQPLILAGGLGTRLRPRTEHLPKPLLPVSGRPMLWYTLQSLSGWPVRQPIVTIDYLGELIEAYFASEPVEFHRHPQSTMAEVVLKEAEGTTATSILGMSADVLLGPDAVRLTLDAYQESGALDTVLFAELPSEGHKKWRFVVSDGRLQEVEVSEENTNFERLLLVLRRDSLLRIRKELPAPVTNDNVPNELRTYQTGWILLLKTLLRLHVTVAARILQVPVCNVNVPDDFERAETFVAKYQPPLSASSTGR